MIIIIRLILLLILPYFVFNETGWATALTLFLILCEIEVRQLKADNHKETMNMSEEQQIKIMEAQLASFDNLIEKMQYMSMAFDKDPAFTQRARDIVRSNICQTLKP